MTINISIPDVAPNLHPQITVLGVGGSGGNAVNNMINSNLEGVDFIIANTDAQALQISNCKKKIQLGIQSTRGLGAGMRPDIGKIAAEETINEISEKLEGSHMLFIAAGMGGGTGTGAAPVIAKLAREKGILTVGVVTKPFHFEGSQRMKLADKGLEELQQYVDTLLTIPNQNLFKIANEKTTFSDAFKMADDVLYAGVRGVTDLMVQPGLINLDFSDVKTVMSEMGKAMMGTGEASGEGRAVAAAEAAIANPLIDDVSLKGAKGLIINITGGNDITLYEVDEAANRIKQEVDEDANIIYGTTCDERLEGVVRVSLVATGIDLNTSASPQPLQQLNTVALSIDNSVYKEDTTEIKDEISKSFVVESESHKDLNENTAIFNNQEISDENAVNNIDIKSNDLNIDSVNDINKSLSSELDELDNLTSDNDVIIAKESSVLENNQDQIFHNSENELEEMNDEEIKKLDSEDLEEILDNEDASFKIEENLKPNVRKLSLFDTLEENNSNHDVESNLVSDKYEPVFQNEERKTLDTPVTSHDNNISDDGDVENEFSAEESDIDDDFNQENEELLDIPTFLRRQAN